MTVALVSLFFALSLEAADWLNEGRLQPLEREITPSTVKDLKLIWKRKLRDGARLSSPIIMGRLITYRGTVELVFVSSSDGRVYAVDGDFGKVFWTRDLTPGSVKCSEPATPGLTANPPDVDPDADEEPPRRPLFVQGPDGLVHSLNPINGKDDGRAGRMSCVGALVVRKNGARALRGARGPVVAGGVEFALAAGTGELTAVDAASRAQLFRSEPVGKTGSALAIANGHVCFTVDSTLFCFGFPMEK